jgi:RecA-family ATPase
MATEISEPVFIVPGLITEGLSVLSGRPKMGKTTFAMNIADASARGGLALGAIQCTQHEVLFLALEDNKRRLRKRVRMMLEAQQLTGAPGLHFRLEWPRLDDGGRDRIDKTCAANRRIKLVIIDTWKKISPRRQKHQGEYEHESEAAGLLQKLAAKYQIAIVIIHHSRKGPGAEDFVDDVLGSTGLTGAVDTIIGFRRKRGTSDAEISIAGRDVDERELALAGDRTSGLWRLVGEAAEHRLSQQRKAILDLLKDGKLRTVKQISEILGRRYDNVRMTIARMCDAQQIKKVGNAYCA